MADWKAGLFQTEDRAVGVSPCIKVVFLFVCQVPAIPRKWRTIRDCYKSPILETSLYCTIFLSNIGTNMQMMEKFSLCYTSLPDVFEESSDSFSLIAIFYANSVTVVIILGHTFLYFIESQHGDVRRDLWNHLIQPPTQADLSRGSCSRTVPGEFWVSLRMVTPQPLWATCASAHSPSPEKTLSISAGRISCARCLLCYQHAWRCQVVLPRHWPLGCTTGHWPQTQRGAAGHHPLGPASQPAFNPCQLCFTSVCFRFSSYWG